MQNCRKKPILSEKMKTKPIIKVFQYRFLEKLSSVCSGIRVKEHIFKIMSTYVFNVSILDIFSHRRIFAISISTIYQ